MQHLARVIYSSVQLGIPAGAYRLLVCYIQPFVVDVLSFYRHIGSFRGLRLNSAIFRYIRTRLYYARQLSYRITSCTLYTCDHGIPNTSLYTSMFMCECNENHHHCSMHIQTYSRRCPCTHTCDNYMHNIQHSYAFDMHIRLVKLLLLPPQRWAEAPATLNFALAMWLT